jgi:virginiamycin B lyase
MAVTDRRAVRGLLVLGASLAICALALRVSAAAAAPAGAITEFYAGLAKGSAPSDITPGPDGNIWFTDDGTTSAIGQITPSGTITEFSKGLGPGSRPRGITTGPDGNLWFADQGTTPAIGRITPSGTITEFSAGLNPGSAPVTIASGADGDLWFTDRGSTPAIGRITPSGTITEFSAGLNAGAAPRRIVAGADGDMWFTDLGSTSAIGRITPGGTITEFSTGLKPGAEPRNIAPGPDGNLWFTDAGEPSAIGQITPSGTITEFSTGLNPGSVPVGIAPGPDGNLWFTDRGSTPAIGRITPTGAITEFSAGLNTRSAPASIAPAADGNLWFTDNGVAPAIGQIGTGAAAPIASLPTISDQAGGVQLCEATWSSWASLQPSTSLFGFDGYHWLLDSSKIASGQSYAPAAADVGAQLACEVTATYPLLDVTVLATSLPVTVTAAATDTGAGAGRRAPVIARLHQSAPTWREGTKLARISRRSTHGRPPVGTTITFVANEPVSVSFSFRQLLPGRIVAKRCVAQTGRNAGHKACTREPKVAALTLKAASGANSVAFQGRVSARKKLPVGRYTLTIIATNSAGVSSAAQSLSFTIVK